VRVRHPIVANPRVWELFGFGEGRQFIAQQVHRLLVTESMEYADQFAFQMEPAGNNEIRSSKVADVSRAAFVHVRVHAFTHERDDLNTLGPGNISDQICHQSRGGYHLNRAIADVRFATD
jgi:hypothetical protein